jgi:leucyl aminopeptidase
MSNGPSRKEQIDKSIQASGDLIGDMFEISTIRREDFKAHKGQSEYEDLMQHGKSSSVPSRGHQGPAAFLIMSSGLDNHGGDSKEPLPYSHIDIAGSSGKFPGIPSAVPLPSFVVEYVLPKL